TKYGSLLLYINQAADEKPMMQLIPKYILKKVIYQNAPTSSIHATLINIAQEHNKVNKRYMLQAWHEVLCDVVSSDMEVMPCHNPKINKNYVYTCFSWRRTGREDLSIIGSACTLFITHDVALVYQSIQLIYINATLRTMIFYFRAWGR
ncbi:hypothetical protein ACJX0J_027389, partial [Zea mays]